MEKEAGRQNRQHLSKSQIAERIAGTLLAVSCISVAYGVTEEMMSTHHLEQSTDEYIQGLADIREGISPDTHRAEGDLLQDVAAQEADRAYPAYEFAGLNMAAAAGLAVYAILRERQRRT